MSARWGWGWGVGTDRNVPLETFCVAKCLPGRLKPRKSLGGMCLGWGWFGILHQYNTINRTDHPNTAHCNGPIPTRISFADPPQHPQTHHNTHRPITTPPDPSQHPHGHITTSIDPSQHPQTHHNTHIPITTPQDGSQHPRTHHNTHRPITTPTDLSQHPQTHQNPKTPKTLPTETRGLVAGPNFFTFAYLDTWALS